MHHHLLRLCYCFDGADTSMWQQSCRVLLRDILTFKHCKQSRIRCCRRGQRDRDVEMLSSQRVRGCCRQQVQPDVDGTLSWLSPLTSFSVMGSRDLAERSSSCEEASSLRHDAQTHEQNLWSQGLNIRHNQLCLPQSRREKDFH